MKLCLYHLFVPYASQFTANINDLNDWIHTQCHPLFQRRLLMGFKLKVLKIIPHAPIVAQVKGRLDILVIILSLEDYIAHE